VGCGWTLSLVGVPCYAHRMDDQSDASQAIDDVVQALKLAGVTEDVIASQLLAKGCFLQLMNGVSADEILDDLEESLIGLAKHISDKS
jgi:hypothetical protein